MIAELDDPGRLLTLERLFSQIWHAEHPPITGDLMRAMSHGGNYVAGIYDDGELIGGGVGFLARDHAGALVLHSHIVGVCSSARARGAGYQLKQHQRRWALERGLTDIYWTFDPLVRRNAHFNLIKLGADAHQYSVNFYGDMDGINAGDESDRLVVRWRLDSARALAAAIGPSREPDLQVLLSGQHVVGLHVSGDGGPSIGPAPDGGPYLCEVPDDIVRMRETNPGSARAWRKALRDTLGRSMESGYWISGITRSGWYVLLKGQ